VWLVGQNARFPPGGWNGIREGLLNPRQSLFGHLKLGNHSQRDRAIAELDIECADNCGDVIEVSSRVHRVPPIRFDAQRAYFVPESIRTIEPVSSSDFRLDTIFGQPPDTAPISFEGSRSIVCMMESFTADPLGSNSSVQSE
jgi:hypothetical protein